MYMPNLAMWLVLFAGAGTADPGWDTDLLYDSAAPDEYPAGDAGYRQRDQHGAGFYGDGRTHVCKSDGTFNCDEPDGNGQSGGAGTAGVELGCMERRR